MGLTTTPRSDELHPQLPFYLLMGDLSKTHQKNLQAKEKPNTDSIQSSVWLVMMHKCNTGIRSRIGK
jgi:hypothetical protein